uniref:substrate-binding domain-containing protein n=1 Tax=Bradyrhizobium sp. Oc8 TaxID=2876780 RepID=UPI00320A41B9
MPGAIGYLEYAYALQRLDKISFGVVQNSAGNFVVPDAASFQAAASSADWTADRDFHLVLTNAPGEDAYPITATTFVVMPKQPKSPERSAAAINFVRWSLRAARRRLKRSIMFRCRGPWSSRSNCTGSRALDRRL